MQYNCIHCIITKEQWRSHPPLPNQLHFSLTREVLDSTLSFHCSSTIRLGLEVNHFYREPAAGVARTGAFIVLSQASFRVARPAGIVGSIRTFQDITIEKHVFYCGLLKVSREPRKRSQNDGMLERSGLSSAFAQSLCNRSPNQRRRPSNATSSRS